MALDTDDLFSMEFAQGGFDMGEHNEDGLAEDGTHFSPSPWLAPPHSAAKSAVPQDAPPKPALTLQELLRLRRMVQGLIASAPPLRLFGNAYPSRQPPTHLSASLSWVSSSEAGAEAGPAPKRLKPTPTAPGSSMRSDKPVAKPVVKTEPSPKKPVAIKKEVLEPSPKSPSPRGDAHFKSPPGPRPPRGVCGFYGVTCRKQEDKKYMTFLMIPREDQLASENKTKGVYLGGHPTAMDAAKAYDRAAIVFFGPDKATLNFDLSNYEEELPKLLSMSREDCVVWLRRDGVEKTARGGCGFKGVLRTRHPGKKKFESRVWNHKGMFQSLGRFDTAAKAACAHDYSMLKFQDLEPPAINFPSHLYRNPDTGVLRSLEDCLDLCDAWPKPEEPKEEPLSPTPASPDQPPSSTMQDDSPEQQHEQGQPGGSEDRAPSPEEQTQPPRGTSEPITAGNDADKPEEDIMDMILSDP